jgi:hypothetical protein
MGSSKAVEQALANKGTGNFIDIVLHNIDLTNDTRFAGNIITAV